MYTLIYTSKDITIVISCEKINLKTEFKDGILMLDFFESNMEKSIILEITKYALYFNGNLISAIDIEDF